MIAQCALEIPIRAIPAHVRVIRGGHRLTPSGGRRGRRGRRVPVLLRRGDQLLVTPPGSLTLSYDGNRFRIRHGRVQLACRRAVLDPGARRIEHVLAIDLQSGLVQVQSGRAHTRLALVISPEMLGLATDPSTNFEVDRNPRARVTRASTRDRPFVAASGTDQTLRIRTRLTYTAIADAGGVRLDVWPFALSRAERRPTAADGLAPFWGDGLQCSVGCAAPGVLPGWPIKPFHQQHAIRAGLNELRPANFHIGIDIEARDFEPVYPIQSGFVRVVGVGTPDEHVQVGQFSYWHIYHRVSDGQYAVAYRTVLGTVKFDFKHVHLSELGPQGQYLNPLRPGGRMLAPYEDIDAPHIAVPHVYADGRAIVGAFDPQSFVERAPYETPVLAPAALAWRLFDVHGRSLTGLEWALRGSQNYPTALKSRIFAPGARNPGYGCFASERLCVPNWVYWLAGGLTQPLPLSRLPRGRYRLSVYAWDWAGNSTALDDWITVPLASGARAPRGVAIAVPDYQ
jgi:hypothetical protein